MFQPIKGTEQNKFTALKMAASTTITAGDALAFTSGYLRPVATGTPTADAEVRYVAMESKTTAGGENPFIKVVDVRETLFIADAAANSDQAAVGTKVDLANATTINVSYTTNKEFFIENTYGALANKQYTGYFVAA